MQQKFEVCLCLCLQTDQSLTWRAVLLINPKQLGMPRLVLRRVPAPVVPSSRSRSPLCSSPSSLSDSSSSTASWFNSHLPSGSRSPSPPASSSLPSPISNSPSSSSSSFAYPSSPSSSSSSSKSPSFSTSSSYSSSSLSFSPTVVPEEKDWIVVPDEKESLKFVLRLEPTGNSSVRSEEPGQVCTPPPSHTEHTPPPSNTKRPQVKTVEDVKWVRKARALVNMRNRQCGVRGGKRAAGPPQGGPPQKRSLKN